MAHFPPQTLPQRAVITITGEGGLAFLHNLITADVAGLQPGGTAYGALLTPQGKILHDLFVFTDGTTLFIDCARPQREALLQKLLMYRLRAKLAIAPDDALVVGVSEAPLPGLGGPDPRLAAMGFRTLVAAGSLGASAGYDALRIDLGLPDSVGDIGMAEHFVHEANLDLLNGVSFTKGCYVGQEVVSRSHHKGTARARMVPVGIDGLAPPHGSGITSGDTKIGTLLSSHASTHGHKAIALLRLDRLAESSAPLLAAGARITVRHPVWMTPDFAIPGAAR